MYFLFLLFFLISVGYFAVCVLKQRYLSGKWWWHKAIPEANSSTSQAEFDKEADSLLAGDDLYDCYFLRNFCFVLFSSPLFMCLIFRTSSAIYADILF